MAERWRGGTGRGRGGAPLWIRRVLVTVLTSPAPSWVARRWGLRLGAGRYVAGPTLDEAVAAAQDLRADGLAATVNFLGEGSAGAAEVASAERTYVEVLRRLEREDLDAGLSIKLSQLGGAAAAAVPLRRILAAAAASGRFVWIDMEGSGRTEATIDLALRLHASGLPLGLCLQAYLRRTPDDLRRVDAAGLPVRLVKGAYAEPPSVAHTTRAAIDQAFAAMLEARLRAHRFTAVATHDEDMLQRALALARESGGAGGQARNTCEFQLLFGIRPDRQRELAAQGWRVRVYVPFGPDWYPYVVRRLAERPANLLLVARDLLGGRPSRTNVHTAHAVPARRGLSPRPRIRRREWRVCPWYRRFVTSP